MMDLSSFRLLRASCCSFVMLGFGGSACWRMALTALRTVSARSASSCLTADSTVLRALWNKTRLEILAYYHSCPLFTFLVGLPSKLYRRSKNAASCASPPKPWLFFYWFIPKFSHLFSMLPRAAAGLCGSGYLYAWLRQTYVVCLFVCLLLFYINNWKASSQSARQHYCINSNDFRY